MKTRLWLATALVVLGALASLVAAQQPTIVPSRKGLLQGSSTITIEGTNFFIGASPATDNVLSLADGLNCTVASNNATQLVCDFPSPPPNGPVVVSALTSNGVATPFTPGIQVATVASLPTISAAQPLPNNSASLIEELTVVGSDFPTAVEDVSVDLLLGAGVASCNVTFASATEIRCVPENSSALVAGPVIGAVIAFQTLTTPPGAVYFVLPVIDEPVGGDLEAGEYPTNVPQLTVSSTSLTIQGHYFANVNLGVVALFLSEIGGNCTVTSVSATAIVCDLVVDSEGLAFHQGGTLVGLVGIPMAVPPFLVTSAPQLLAFVGPDVDAPAKIPRVTSGFNVTTTTLNITGQGFYPTNSSRNIVLLMPEGEPEIPLPATCNITDSGFSWITCEVQPYATAGNYTLRVITDGGPSVSLRYLTVVPMIYNVSEMFCCINSTYSPIMVEGAGFSLTKDENTINFDNSSLFCEPIVGSPGFAFDFTMGNFSGNASNGVFICLMERLADGISSVRATLTTRNITSAAFDVPGPGPREDADSQSLAAIVIVCLFGGFVLIVLLVLAALSRGGGKKAKAQAETDEEPLITIVDGEQKPRKSAKKAKKRTKANGLVEQPTDEARDADMPPKKKNNESEEANGGDNVHRSKSSAEIAKSPSRTESTRADKVGRSSSRTDSTADRATKSPSRVDSTADRATKSPSSSKVPRADSTADRATKSPSSSKVPRSDSSADRATTSPSASKIPRGDSETADRATKSPSRDQVKSTGSKHKITTAPTPQDLAVKTASSPSLVKRALSFVDYPDPDDK